MLSNRHDLGVAAVGHPFYAIGGHDGRTFLNSVERYDPDTTTWTYVSSMNFTRCTFGVAVLDQRYVVFVIEFSHIGWHRYSF